MVPNPYSGSLRGEGGCGRFATIRGSKWQRHPGIVIQLAIARDSSSFTALGFGGPMRSVVARALVIGRSNASIPPSRLCVSVPPDL